MQGPSTLPTHKLLDIPLINTDLNIKIKISI